MIRKVMGVAPGLLLAVSLIARSISAASDHSGLPTPPPATGPAPAMTRATAWEAVPFVPPAWMVDSHNTALIEALKNVKMYHNVEYVPGGGLRQSMDILLPTTITQAKSPVVIWLHGGPHGGKKEDWSPAYCLLLHGYVVVNADYRWAQFAPLPEELADIKAVVRWIRAHADKLEIDPARVGIWGHSWGGTLTALMGATGGVKELEGNLGNPEFSSTVQAAVVWSGSFIDSLKGWDMLIGMCKKDVDIKQMVRDIKSISGPNAKAMKEEFARKYGIPDGWFENTRSLLMDQLGGFKDSSAATRELAGKLDPTTYINDHTPPFAIMYGTYDWSCITRGCNALASALVTQGVECTFVPQPGKYHGIGGEALENQVVAFFDRHLRGPATTQPTLWTDGTRNLGR